MAAMAATTSEERQAEILRLWAEGRQGTRLIGERVGVSQSAVQRILRRNGVFIAAEEARQRKRRTTPEQDAEIVRRYLAGESAVDLAAEYGFMTHVSVTQRVRDAGQAIRPVGGRPKPFTTEQADQILRLHDSGWSQERIAWELKTQQRRISKWLLSQGRRSREVQRRPRVKMSNGYYGVMIDDNDLLFADMAAKNRYILEHRLVVARALGRPLLKTETVHHINGDKSDNRLENLQLRQGRHGKGARFACLDCGSHNVGPVPLS